MKNIVITSEVIEAACLSLRTQLQGSFVLKDKLDISIPTKITIKDEDKPTIMVSLIADRKMKELVDQCDKEIAWHGTVSYDAELNTYLIEDIFVFPQEITGTTVQSIDEEYGLWLMETFDDNTFNKVRLHGHSHVNMHTSPSGIDTAYQENLISRIQDFYIFLILNKRENYYVCLYDVANNLMYEEKDLIYDTELDPVEMWAADQIDNRVKNKTYPVVTTTTTTAKGLADLIEQFNIVSKVWYADWGWDMQRQAYTPNTYKAAELWLENKKKAAEATQKKIDKESTKRERGRPKGSTNKPNDSAYKEYQKERVKQIEAARSAHSVYEYPIDCDGNCIVCNNKQCPYHFD